MRVLGVDPGTRKTGYGVLEGGRGSVRAIAHGVIRMNPKRPLADRLEEVHDTLNAIIDEHSPNALAVEDVFYAKFANAAIKLAHMRGVVLLVAARRGLGLAEYPPALVKRTVAGRGAAEKEQITRLMTHLLRLEEAPAEDAADALAVALTHLRAVGR